MHWRWYHTLVVGGWAGVVVLGQVAIGPPAPATLLGVLVGAVGGALLVVWVLGSCWQWVVRRLRGRRQGE